MNIPQESTSDNVTRVRCRKSQSIFTAMTGDVLGYLTTITIINYRTRCGSERGIALMRAFLEQAKIITATRSGKCEIG